MFDHREREEEVGFKRNYEGRLIKKIRIKKILSIGWLSLPFCIPSKGGKLLSESLPASMITCKLGESDVFINRFSESITLPLERRVH